MNPALSRVAVQALLLLIQARSCRAWAAKTTVTHCIARASILDQLVTRASATLAGQVQAATRAWLQRAPPAARTVISDDGVQSSWSQIWNSFVWWEAMFTCVVVAMLSTRLRPHHRIEVSFFNMLTCRPFRRTCRPVHPIFAPRFVQRRAGRVKLGLAVCYTAVLSWPLWLQGIPGFDCLAITFLQLVWLAIVACTCTHLLQAPQLRARSIFRTKLARSLGCVLLLMQIVWHCLLTSWYNQVPTICLCIMIYLVVPRLVTLACWQVALIK
eukprot:COSAG01_NODE_9576_length_2404_cov_1.721475_2_plen_270_part_00